MGGYRCLTCETKYKGQLSFCPRCDNPTPFATAEETKEWDLRQWRQHRDRAAEERTVPTPRLAASVAIAGRRPEVPIHHERPTGQRTERRSPPHERAERGEAQESSERKSTRRQKRSRTVRSSLSKIMAALPRPARATSEPARVIALDVDDPFAYTSCPSCQGGDWILRTKRNDEGSWNYWCVRCSRGFKTQFRLAHGRKPFVVVGAILTILIALPNLL